MKLDSGHVILLWSVGFLVGGYVGMEHTTKRDYVLEDMNNDGKKEIVQIIDGKVDDVFVNIDGYQRSVRDSLYRYDKKIETLKKQYLAIAPNIYRIGERNNLEKELLELMNTRDSLANSFGLPSRYKK